MLQDGYARVYYESNSIDILLLSQTLVEESKDLRYSKSLKDKFNISYKNNQKNNQNKNYIRYLEGEGRQISGKCCVVCS